jgi:hypothetical protein
MSLTEHISHGPSGIPSVKRPIPLMYDAGVNDFINYYLSGA